MSGPRAQKQATKSTTPSSQHHALVTVVMHRDHAPPPRSPFAASQCDPHTIHPRHSQGRHCMGQGTCQAKTGCRSHHTPTAWCAIADPGGCNGQHIGGKGPYENGCLSGERGSLQTNVAITSTPGARPDPKHKASHKKHHNIQSASRSCDSVNASRSRTSHSPFAAGQCDPHTTVLATAWVKAPVKHRSGARSHQPVRQRRTRRVQRQ